MAQECPHCGMEFDSAAYTLPWEDGDNEYGYWECPYCHIEVTDWNSGDD